MHRRFSLTAIVMVLFIVLLAVSCGEDPFFYDLVVRNGDEVITSAVLYVGDEYTLPSSPDMRGRVFDGWAVNGDKSDLKAPGERIRITGSTTVDAVWGEIIDKPDVSSVDRSTVYRAGDTISLTAPEGTTLRWTVDGTEPSATNGTEGTEVSLSGTAGLVSVKVAAVKNGGCSETESFVVKVEPSISFDRSKAETVSPDDTVKVSVPSGVSVYYTTDGSTPTASGTKYDSTTGIPLGDVRGKTTIRVLAVKDGVESTSELTLNVVSVAPDLDVDTTATYSQGDSVTLTVPEGSTIRYTTDGTDPTATTGTVYKDGISLEGLSGNVNIKAVVVKDGEASAVKDITLKVQPTAPTYSASASKTYDSTESILFDNLPANTTIHYTTDGTDPTAASRSESDGKFISLSGLSGKETVKYVAVKDGIASEVKTIEVSVKPAVSFDKAASSNLGQDDSVKITVPENTAVYYTTDGSIPTLSSTKYDSTDGISLKNELGNTTIKVLAVKDNVSSDISSLTVLVKGTAPEVEDTETTYPRNGSVKLDVPEGAVAYYTINGDDPTDKSVKYDSETGIPLSGYSGDVTIKTVMYKDGVVCSEVGTKTVKVQPTAPDYTVSASAYSTTDKLTFTGLSDGTTIYYTTDGSVPTKDSKTESDGKSISLSGLSGKKTVKYVAVKDGVVSEVKTMEVSVKPDITFNSEEDAELKRSDSVKITVPGNTTVYYTTDGSTPTKSSSAYNTSGIPLENALGTTTIRVLAVTSDGVEATSDLRVKVEIPGPEITVDGNKSYAQGDKLTVTVPSGTTVRYTTDGTEPTATEGNVYDSSTGIPLTGLSGEATIKAVIVKGEEYSATATTVNVKVKPAVLTKPTLEAKYSEDGSIEFTALASGTSVRYTLDGTAVTSSSAVAEGNRISLAGTLGDADSKDVTVRAVAEKDGVISDEITFKVTVKKKSVLTLNLGGGTLSEGVPQTYSYVDSGTVTLPTSGQISKAGCSFDGWYTTSDATTTGYISTATYAATGNAEIYALWIPAGLNIDESGKVTSSIGVSGEIVIPAVYHGKAVTEIAGNAFYDSSAKKGADITKVTIPSSVTKIGKGAFQGCSSITSADIKANITELPEGTFSGCESLSDVTLPDSLTTIGNSALKGTALTSVNLKNVTSIGNSAFEECKSLSSITMDKVTVIGSSAFSNTALTSFTVPSGVTKIDSAVFANCSKLSSITFDGAITEIGDNAFQNCTGLTAVSVPDSVTSIGDYAFDGCTNLNTVTISKTGSMLQTIGAYAFASTGLTSTFVIPESITSIDDNAFSNCTSSFTFDIDNVEGCISNYDASTKWGAANATVNWAEGYTITYNSNGGNGTIATQTVKKGNSVVLASADGYTKSGYKNDGWYTTKTPSSSTYVEAGKPFTPESDVILYANWINSYLSFADDDSKTGWSVGLGLPTGFKAEMITEIVIPGAYKGKTVTTIEGLAFAFMADVVTLEVPEGVKYLKDSCFSGCAQLQLITLPSTIETIESGVFSDVKSNIFIKINRKNNAISGKPWGAGSSATVIWDGDK